jgi:hypothetical protein
MRVGSVSFDGSTAIRRITVRQLFITVLMLLSGTAAAQPGVSIGVGSGDCRDVAQQIVHDWFEVHELMTSDSGVRPPSAKQFQCVAPAELEGAMQKHVGGSRLRCYVVGHAGVCCDPQMSSCASLSQ